ncbi:hypothetical protein ACFC0X_07015 [Paenibacillus chitinolyticus]|uniref:hypothetical protein n=1 Tax=Paenibacillus chitinolyticus TaxID=79263 RepID=UPI0035E0A15C
MNTILHADRKKRAWNELIPAKERKRVYAAALLTGVLVLAGMLYLLQQSGYHTRGFKGIFKNYGSLARLVLFFVLANYVLLLMLRKKLLDRLSPLKKAAVALSRFVRKWHTPAALIAIGLIVLHIAAVFMYGFVWDFHNISGLLALAALLPVPVSGLFRYKKPDRSWHLGSGLAFAVLFLLHAFI